jgi:hypothetical protein
VFKEWQKKNQIVTLIENNLRDHGNVRNHHMRLNPTTTMTNGNGNVQTRMNTNGHSTHNDTLLQFESPQFQAGSGANQSDLSTLDCASQFQEHAHQQTHVLNYNLDIKLKHIARLNRQSTTINELNQGPAQPGSVGIIV